jgi:hypothetical protein
MVVATMGHNSRVIKPYLSTSSPSIGSHTTMDDDRSDVNNVSTVRVEELWKSVHIFRSSLSPSVESCDVADVGRLLLSRYTYMIYDR